MYATPGDGSNCRNMLRGAYSNINIHKDICFRTGKETLNLFTPQSTLKQLILLSVEQRAQTTVCYSPVRLLVQSLPSSDKSGWTDASPRGGGGDRGRACFWLALCPIFSMTSSRVLTYGDPEASIVSKGVDTICRSVIIPWWFATSVSKRLENRFKTQFTWLFHFLPFKLLRRPQVN
jgi:hypothetical protein